MPRTVFTENGGTGSTDLGADTTNYAVYYTPPNTGFPGSATKNKLVKANNRIETSPGSGTSGNYGYRPKCNLNGFADGNFTDVSVSAYITDSGSGSWYGIGCMFRIGASDPTGSVGFYVLHSYSGSANSRIWAGKVYLSADGYQIPGTKQFGSYLSFGRYYKFSLVGTVLTISNGASLGSLSTIDTYDFSAAGINSSGKVCIFPGIGLRDNTSGAGDAIAYWDEITITDEVGSGARRIPPTRRIIR